MPRIVRPTALGSPDVLTVVDVPTPVPPADGLVVQVRAAGVNPIDRKLYSGMFHQVADEHRDAHGAAAELPSLGLECAGVVAR